MELSEHTRREAAILKMEAAHDLLVEAYDLWKEAEIKRSRDRVLDAIDEVRELRDERAQEARKVAGPR